MTNIQSSSINMVVDSTRRVIFYSTEVNAEIDFVSGKIDSLLIWSVSDNFSWVLSNWRDITSSRISLFGKNELFNIFNSLTTTQDYKKIWSLDIKFDESGKYSFVKLNSKGEVEKVLFSGIKDTKNLKLYINSSWLLQPVAHTFFKKFSD